MLKKTIAALSLLSILAACQSDGDSQKPKPRKDIILTRTEQQITNSGTDFAFRFFTQVCASETKKPNLFVSPLSASFCLSMIANGASGNTLAEMKSTLGFTDYSLEDMNNYNQKLATALLDLDNTTRIGIANSIWLKQGFSVYDDFLNVNKRMYDARVQELDFASPKAIDIINQWCIEKTNNCIKEVIQEIPEEVRMYLLNALYFKGIWKNQFKKSDTKQEVFNNADGSKSEVPMMNLSMKSFNYIQNDFFSIAELPYGNEAFSMVVFLPAENKTLDESLPKLTYENWNEWNGKLFSNVLNVKLPRFELKYDKDLITDMIELGMKDAFTDAADFSKMSAFDLSIGILSQFTFVNVNEEGTEAAAVTVGGMVETSAGPSSSYNFYVDRPFVFMIKEKSTGAILFMGKVTKL